jgi:serine/threonine protein kinase
MNAKNNDQDSKIWTTSVLDQAFGCLAGDLVFMHENRIRHKESKPANILVHKGVVLSKSQVRNVSSRMTYRHWIVK